MSTPEPIPDPAVSLSTHPADGVPAPAAGTPEAAIAELVRVFYGRARAHPDLAPVFSAAVADWDAHLRTVADFWSHALLGTARYQGHPYPFHLNLGIERPQFDTWLALFREAAAQTLPPALASAAVGRAEHMARAFKAGLFPFDPV